MCDDVLDFTNINDSIESTTTESKLLELWTKWFYYELFTSCSNNRLYQPGIDFAPVTSYETPTSNSKGLDFAEKLLQFMDPDQINPTIQNWKQNGISKYETLFDFPQIILVNDTSVTIRLCVPFDDSSDLDIETMLKSFYNDSEWGSYTLNDTTQSLTNTFVLTDTFVKNSAYDVNATVEINPQIFMYGYTVQIQLGFMPFLYQLVAETTNTGYVVPTTVLNGMTQTQFESIRVDESVPIPTSLQTIEYCTSSDSCACTYFVVFKGSSTATEMPYSTPSHNLYVNRFQSPNCLCFVSRAVPQGETMILNPFSLCFDQNCINGDVDIDPSLQCSKQCDTAQQYVGSVNWENNIINPGTINTDLVEQTCGFKVTPLSSNTDRWFVEPLLIAGAVLWGLSVPLYTIGLAVKQKLETRSIFNVVQFKLSTWIWLTIYMLITWGIAGLGLYALHGTYVCDYATLENRDKQAQCVDRLTGLLSLSRSCCDQKNPHFCQCDPSTWSQQVCRSSVVTTFCKCQSNGSCIASSGESSIFSKDVEESLSLNAQFVFLVLGAYVVLTPLLSLGVDWFVEQWSPNPKWWMFTLVQSVLIFLSAIVFVGIPVLLSYYLWPEQIQAIDVETQSSVCSIESE